MKQVDREALRRCLDLAMQDSKRAVQMEAKKAAGESWEKRALFACFCVQIDNLRLKPWECPPCHSESEPPEAKARLLAERLSANGLSIFESDPVEALRRCAEAKHTASSPSA